MEVKKRGRPATGIIRNKKLTLMLTDDEKQIIKQAQEKHNQKSVIDLLLHLIKQN